MAHEISRTLRLINTGHASGASKDLLCEVPSVDASDVDLLDAYSDHLVGIHLHDAKGLDDHLAPGSGEVDFKKILSILKPSHIKILEIHPKVDKQDLIQGIDYIKNHLTE